ncbi:TPA: methyl-accepting chemotaxis protein [Bacillus cereus]|uniref:methyl-accepting chemotaxis protein n=1 Tax=Bacillus cereus group sp. BfR-BA-01347 TaxID=2920310 RepID=UPI0010407BD3|nr:MULTISPECIES: HAMP domain-containing methyl-accepting chemotaxis protein [Bacillus cereus group]MBJ8150841.1 methyl-accepting chemotaxis protein [Bacillus cereus]MBJ8204813.1 methyl-accepting chemotaxis protein [Bacillus cereus]MDA2328004.1 HAMP domain-containing methyl-accepting chemotaxis protein [Bacillus cereus]MDA2333581.1 HAMP domain-containing methyl-accepting chemotaxis protein [Bacillus cereus]MDA2353389.1 HAMP domain-containing methyl-accepting chemotaxis protein [Bacillus cereus]
MYFLQNLKVKYKLLSLISLAVLGMVIISSVAISSINKIKHDTEVVVDDYQYSAILLEGMLRTQNSLEYNLLELITASQNEVANKEGIIDNIEKDLKKYDSLLKEYDDGFNLSKQEDELFQKMKKSLPSYKDTYKKLFEKAKATNEPQMVHEFQKELKPKGIELAGYAVDLESYVSNLADQVFKDSQKMIDRSVITFIILVVVTTIVICIVSYIISKLIVAPLQTVSRMMERAKEGDLTVHGDYTAKDELGVLVSNFNEMIAGLRTNMQEVENNIQLLFQHADGVVSASEVSSSAAKKITMDIEEVANGAESQMQAMEQTAGAMEELTQGMQSIVNTSSSVNELSAQSALDAENGNKLMKQMIQQMDTIQNSVHSGVKQVETMKEQSEEIVKIIDVMQGITSQINLLALNAAIEAARAGESGRGFAIVADEVRKLAEQSSDSAKQIENLITQVMGTTNHTVHMMGKVDNEVQAGTQVVMHTEKVFGTITEKVQQVSEQIQTVSMSTDEIAASSEEISASAEDMAQISQRSSDRTDRVKESIQQQEKSVQEISVSIEHMHNAAGKLKQIVAQFTLQK